MGEIRVGQAELGGETSPLHLGTGVEREEERRRHRLEAEVDEDRGRPERPDPDGGDLPQPRLGDRLPARGQGSGNPGAWILLDSSRAGHGRFVRSARGAEQASVGREDDRFDAGEADVDPESADVARFAHRNVRRQFSTMAAAASTGRRDPRAQRSGASTVVVES